MKEDFLGQELFDELSTTDYHVRKIKSNSMYGKIRKHLGKDMDGRPVFLGDLIRCNCKLPNGKCKISLPLLYHNEGHVVTDSADGSFIIDNKYFVTSCVAFNVSEAIRGNGEKVMEALAAQSILETSNTKVFKDSHMINCGVCHKPTDTFIKGNVTINTDRVNNLNGKLNICARCLTNLSKAFDQKYKKLPVIETEASEWEAWSTPTDES